MHRVRRPAGDLCLGPTKSIVEAQRAVGFDDRAARAHPAGVPATAGEIPATGDAVTARHRDPVTVDNWDPIGLRGTASESYTVADLFVPEEFTGTREDPSLRREPGPLYAFPQQTLYSVGIASVALGIARGMLEAFVEQSRLFHWEQPGPYRWPASSVNTKLRLL